jgi:hypothetical protein
LAAVPGSFTPSIAKSSRPIRPWRSWTISQEIIAGRVHHSATLLLNASAHDLAIGGQGADSRFPILPHEVAVALDIGTEDGGEFAFHTRLWPVMILPLLYCCQPVWWWQHRWLLAEICRRATKPRLGLRHSQVCQPLVVLTSLARGVVPVCWLTIDCMVSAYLLHLSELDNDWLSLLVFGFLYNILLWELSWYG